MVRKFTVHTTKRVFKGREKGKGNIYVDEPLTLEVNMRIEGKVVHLGYGYKEWWTEHREDGFSEMPYEKYMLHNSLRPKEGDVWEYGKRKFTVGEKEGFLIYTAPLMENGVEVARVKFEDYYMD